MEVTKANVQHDTKQVVIAHCKAHRIRDIPQLNKRKCLPKAYWQIIRRIAIFQNAADDENNRKKKVHKYQCQHLKGCVINRKIDASPLFQMWSE